MKKLITSIITAICVMTVITGCSRGEFTTKAEKLMADKYGEKFTTIDSRDIGYGSQYVWMIPKKEPGIVVRAEVDNGNAVSISDNYPLKKVCKEITDTANSLMSYNGKYYIHTDNMYDYQTTDKEKFTAEEYLSNNPGDRFDVSVFVERGADPGRLYDEVARLQSSIRISSGWIDVYVIPEGSLKELRSEIEKYDDKNTAGAQEIIDRGTQIFVEIGGDMPSANVFKAELES